MSTLQYIGRTLISIAKVGALTALFTVGGYYVYISQLTGAFETPVESSFVGDCQPVTGIIGPEDITIHPRTGTAFISAYDRIADRRGLPVRGGIYTYAKGVLRNLSGDMPASARPHGISLWVNPEYPAWAASARRKRSEPEPLDRLFVVDHGDGEEKVVVYAIAGDRLRFEKSVRSPKIHHPHDVLAVGRDRFYVTNDASESTGLMAFAERFLGLPRSDVVYYDGADAKVVAERIKQASGIAASADGKQVFVAGQLSSGVSIFSRDLETGALTPGPRIIVNGVPDNIEVDEEGALWIGTHPRFISLTRARMAGSETMASLSLSRLPFFGRFFSEGSSLPSEIPLFNLGAVPPSRIVRVREDGDEVGQYQLAEMYENAGDEISGASVGARSGNRLLIGSLTDQKILDCVLNPFPRRDYKVAEMER